MQIFNIASIYKGVVNSDSFSVHDFDILTLYPLDFEEFLWANAEFALTSGHNLVGCRELLLLEQRP